MEKQLIIMEIVNNMKRIFLISIFCVYSTISFGQSNKSVVYNGEQLANIVLNDDVPISKLYYQSENFSDVLKLGDVKDRECEKSPVDEVCVFTFPNMKITYINLNGDFELSEILFFGKQSGIKINDEKIFIGEHNISQNQQRTSKSVLSSFKNGQGLSSKQKFEGGYTYMELFIDENDKIEKIVYKRSLL